MSLEAQQYTELEEIDHALHRPDLYIGSIQRRNRQSFVFSSEKSHIVEGTVTHSEAQEQTFIEIIMNAGDNVERTRTYNTENKKAVPLGNIEVMIYEDSISVCNGGLFIPVTKSETGKMIPEMIFGNLRSGSSFDDTKMRTWIGRNGVGAKATNLFSKWFKIECADTDRRLLYKQTWTNNMRHKTEPDVTSYHGPAYTRVTYSLDFERFGSKENDEEALSLYVALCCNVAYTSGVPVTVNGQAIKANTISQYATLYHPLEDNMFLTYKDPVGTYEFCIVDTPTDAVSVSFVNGAITKEGGVHVDALYTEIRKMVLELFPKETEGLKLTKRDITPYLSVFLSCRLPNPQFRAQIKDYLTHPKPSIAIPAQVLKKMKKWKFIERLHQEINQKHLAKLKKTDGKKCKRVDIPKAEEANLVVQNNGSTEASLIITEGDSANSYAVKFIGNVPGKRGRDYYGTFPIRGKILNTINADIEKIYNNKELCAIKQILGLAEGVDYSVPKEYRKLRYGSLLIITDADNDGKHILGLILIYFMKYFKELVDIGFVKFLRTPVVRLLKTGARFYTLSSFHRWAVATSNPEAYEPKYYKGLGTTPDEHITLDYKESKIVVFKATEASRDSILLAFDKTRADDRKKWIIEYVDKEVLEFEHFKELPIETFIDYELVSYSIENVIRAIPEQIDGLKESQRKVLFGAINLFGKSKKGKKVFKTTQIASHSDMITCYKHGPTCLADTIINMTQDFIGSNNMAYFQGHGQFGTRDAGGKDAANPRYPENSLPWWIDSIYRKEDRLLEKRIVEDGEKRECENFFPIIPMHLVNGQVGVGSAWSTYIPSHNPLDIVLWLQCRLKALPLPCVMPWFRGFTGEIKLTKYGFCTYGRYRVEGNKVIIDELPVGVWTKPYYNTLKVLEKEGICKTVTSNSDAFTVYFTLYDYIGQVNHRALKLTKQRSYQNMTVLYRTKDRDVKPVKFNSVQDILEDFYHLRLEIYRHRKDRMIEQMMKNISDLDEKLRLIIAIRDEKLIITGGREEEAVKQDMIKLDLNPDMLDKVSVKNILKNPTTSAETMKAKLDTMVVDKDKYAQVPAEDMWYAELNEFIKHYCKHYNCKMRTIGECTVYKKLTTAEEVSLLPVEEEVQAEEDERNENQADE